MDSASPQDRINQLTDRLNHLNQLYYLESISEVSDQEFDLLLKELESLENEYQDLKRPDSPTQRVGGDVTKHFKTVKHRYPMLSLSNTYTEEELIDFDLRVKKGLDMDSVEYFCELKFDGVALSFIYEDGLLTHAVTRGDGEKGDDITANARTIRTVPLKVNTIDLPKKFEARGEAFMPKSVFEKLNKKRLEDGEALLANPRNTTSGTLKMQDSAVVASRKIDCFLYSLHGEDLPQKTHAESINFLEQCGFNVSPTYGKCKDIQEVVDYVKEWEQKRHDLPVETDGIVIKVNNLNHQSSLGYTAKSPRWAIAFKYKSESARTKLIKITPQIGRTGAITPVAELAPVVIAGTTVKRASLHNSNEIERLDIREGDYVFVEKGGEIIPKVTKVDFDSRSDQDPFTYFAKCPACDSQLIKIENEAAHYCPNQSGCPPQISGRIEHYISRNALNIETLGPQTIKGLINHRLIATPADLYSLSFDLLNGLNLEGTETKGRSIQHKTATNILASIEKSKEIPFENVLFGLGIRYVGKTVAEKLVQHFGSLDAIANASKDQLTEANEIGERIALSVLDFFSNSDNVEMISQLRQAGVKLEGEIKPVEAGVLSNKVLVVSGTFERLSRDQIKKLIKENGGKVGSSVSSKTDYLIAGDNMGPAKKSKAENLGIEILSEYQFLNMIEPDA